ncbi:hypothetical protein [Actinoplanes sp. NPDC051851]|uniref:hypothetical protein n=1 Tax=Actinoplanes sp. NPDC051851 TaxID=3154753 RepID=UPI003430488C
MTRRFLRPGYAVAAGDLLWVVDRLQPVAALLDAATGVVRRLVSWPDLPPPPVDEQWRVLGWGADLWVQPGRGGPVARVTPDGEVYGGYSAGRWLYAVEARGAWCSDPPDQVLLSGPDEEPPELGSHRLFLVAPDGGSRYVDVDRPVRDIVVGEDAVYLEVDELPYTKHHIGCETFDVTWRSAWLKVPPGPVPEEELRLADHEVGDPRCRPMEKREIPEVGEVDITEHCWPLPARPVDARSFADYQLACFTGLDRAWQDVETGARGPLANGTSRWTASLSGDWPATELVLSFDHDDYPGLRLRRRLSIFDELGRPSISEFADIHLMEDIDTDALPPAAGAVGGVLEV